MYHNPDTINACVAMLYSLRINAIHVLPAPGPYGQTLQQLCSPRAISQASKQRKVNKKIKNIKLRCKKIRHNPNGQLGA